MEDSSQSHDVKDAVVAMQSALCAWGEMLGYGCALSDDILESEEICAVLAGTNAAAWSINDVCLRSIELAGNKHDMIAMIAKLEWHASGAQDPDHMYCGDKAQGVAKVLLKADGTFELLEVDGCVCDYQD